MPKPFSELSEREVLALAISLEEEDGRIYGDFAERLHEGFPSTAAMLLQLQREESTHRQRLIDQYRSQFGEHIPLIHRSDVRGFVRRRPVWLIRALSVAQVRRQVGVMELESRRFYEVAAARTADASTRRLLGDLALAEADHSAMAERLVGLASSVGAGISMGFAEALSDDGTLSGRGHPLVRGAVCGLMTAAGGLGHTLPFMISAFNVAFTVAVCVVLVELVVISWIRHHYMDTRFLSAAFQVIVGGLLVFFAGMLIGSS